ncbi:MAG: hypothetical protein KGL04_03965 [Elusimicrobia bacterium]|nr:hypothetical protein [Elusimicrobiota bacterium]MDE2313314.1 hypothetical protein [Elusimicrobiota bacterium]
MPAEKTRDMIRAQDLESAVARKNFPVLAQELSHAPPEALVALWPTLKPMTKLAAFKLLSPDRAIALYERLGFDEKYFVFCGFAPASIAPLLEDVPPAERKIFTELPRWHYDRMLDLLLREKDAAGGSA